MRGVSSGQLAFLRPSGVMARRPQSVTDVEAIARRLRLTRLSSRLTQAAFSRHVGINSQAWNNYETADRRISLEAALRVCVATGATLDWIYRGITSGLPLSLATTIAEIERAEGERVAVRAAGGARG